VIIEALFSNDVYKLWAAFPGYGVIQNGRAYSPEWIMNNIEQAMIEEEIPLDYVIDIMVASNDHSVLNDITTKAKVGFQRGLSRMQMSQEQLELVIEKLDELLEQN